MAFEIAADVGGTFTDLVLRGDNGDISIFKSTTTAGNISNGIFNGLDLIANRLGMTTETLLRDCKSFACGTTAATNAILEGKAAKTGLICTDGFRDTLLAREGGKPDSSQIYVDYPAPYIPRYLTFGVQERMNSEGQIETPLNEDHVRRAIAELKEYRVEAVAVALLWSIVNPAHELRIGELLDEEMKGMAFSLSHQVAPILREYRRTSAVSIDASLKPIMQRTIAELQTRLKLHGFDGVLTFVTSNGGRTSPEAVVARPVYLCLSGPSAAPQAGSRIARSEGVERGNLLTIDMGGTSFDVTVSVDWETATYREGSIDGHMFGIPATEVKTIGAGGGSIARLDAGGFIHVGPASAGAYPGPVCYGRGGRNPTVTDANLVRGLLDPDRFADGQLRLDKSAAAEAIRVQIAEPLGISVMEAANLICVATEQNMVAAIEDLTVRRGIDPREFILISGGAAAGLHSGAIARELGMTRLLVPRTAGVLSAFGIITGDIMMTFGRSLFASALRFDYAAVNSALAGLRSEGIAFLDAMDVPSEQRELIFSVEGRYASQVWQLTIPLTVDEVASEADLAAIVESFHVRHEIVYSLRSPGDEVEFTEWNLRALGRVPQLLPVEQAEVEIADASTAAKGMRPVFLKEAGGAIELAVYDRALLGPGNCLAGPALIEEALTTTLVPPGAVARCTRQGSIMIDLKGTQDNSAARRL